MGNGKNESGASLSDRIGDFVQRNRTVIFFSIGFLVVLFTGFLIFLSAKEYFQNKATAEVEELNRKYVDIKSSGDDHDHDGDGEPDHPFDEHEDAAAETGALLEELTVFAKGKGSYAGARAWYIIANIYIDRKDWQQAEQAWLNCAKTGNRTYLAPIAFFNAAAAAEEQGNLEQAAGYLSKCIEHPFGFSEAARAQFAIGRINETRGDFPAALEAYRTVLAKWPKITLWTNLAHSRITALEIQTALEN